MLVSVLTKSHSPEVANAVSSLRDPGAGLHPIHSTMGCSSSCWGEGKVLWDKAIHPQNILSDSGLAKECRRGVNREKEAVYLLTCSLVLTTSNGQVTTVAMAPAHLSREG